MELSSGSNLILWAGIGFCITQSAIKVLKLREDSNFLLAAIFENIRVDPGEYCHEPILIKDSSKCDLKPIYLEGY